MSDRGAVAHISPKAVYLRGAAVAWLAAAWIAVAWLWAAPVQAQSVELPATATPVRAKTMVIPGIGLPAAGTDSEPSAAMVALQLLGDAAAAKAEALCLRRRVGSLDIEGCEGSACADPAVKARLLSLTDIAVGWQLAPGKIRLGTERLRQVGYFKQVTPVCVSEGGGRARLRFVVVANQFVRSVVFRGNGAILQDELRAKLVLQPGDVLNLDTKEGLAKLQAQRDAFEALYRKNGFDDARVDLTTESIATGELRLVVQIEEGDRKRVAQVKVSIAPLAPPTAEERRHGLLCPAVGERGVLVAADASKLEVFSQREVNRVRGRVRAYLRRIGYGTPRIEVVHDQAEQTVRIDVRAGRCALVRVLVRDDSGGGGSGGYVLSDDKALYDALPFADSGLFDFEEAERGRLGLLSALENRGHLFAEVRLDFRPVPPQISAAMSAAVTYYVTTGYISQVRGIFFHPLDHPRRPGISDDELRTVLSSKAYDFFGSGGFLQVDQLLADLDALRAHFLSQGYYQFHYATVLPEGVTPTATNHRIRQEIAGQAQFIYRYPDKGFRVRRPAGENFIYIDIDYREGERARLESLTIEGAVQVSQAELKGLLPIKVKEVISYELLAQAVKVLEQRYRNNGFFKMKFRATCSASQPDMQEGECEPRSVLARSVRVKLVIEEGERVRFGESFLIGNFGTDNDVILRDLPEPGRPWSAAEEAEAQRRLRNLGLFSQVSLQHIGDREKPPRERMASALRLVEGSNRYWEMAVGFQTINTQRSPFEVTTANSVRDAIDRWTTATDRMSLGFGSAQNLTLPNLLATAEGSYINRNFLRSGKLLRLTGKVGATLPPDYSGVPYGPAPLCANTAKANECVAWYNNSRREPPWWSDTLRYAAVQAIYEDPRLFGSQTAVRVVAPYLEHDYAIAGYDADRVGTSVTLARRFGKLGVSLVLNGGKIRTRLASERNQDFDQDFEWQYSVGPQLAYDNTDSPINPRSGFSLKFELPYINAMVTPLARGNTLEVRPFRANLFKWDTTARWFLPLGDALTLAMALHGGGGYSLDSAAAALPTDARFRLGGSLPQGLVRGYSDGGIRQYDQNGCTKVKDASGHLKACGSSYEAGDFTLADGNAVANGSVELRFPVIAAAGVFGAVFWDLGGLSESWGEWHRNAIRHGFGAGVRYLIAGQIPVRLDYGLAIGAQCRDVVLDEVSGNYLCAQDEFGKLNLGVLYAF